MSEKTGKGKEDTEGKDEGLLDSVQMTLVRLENQ
jgi:hypothetical protein